jgi:hypothetical protein
MRLYCPSIRPLADYLRQKPQQQAPAIGFFLGLLAFCLINVSASAQKDVLWQHTFAIDGANHNLAGASADPREFFGKVSDPTRMTWAATDPEADASKDPAAAATVGERFVLIDADLRGEVMLETESYDGLVAVLNTLPPGQYDLTMQTTLRDRGRHVRRIQFESQDRPGGKVRRESRWINPKVGDRFEVDQVEMSLVVMESGVEPTAAGLQTAIAGNDNAIAFLAGSLKTIRTTQWVGSEGKTASMAIARITFRSQAIAAVAGSDPRELINVTSIRTPGTVFMFHRSEPGPMTVTLSNLAAQAYELDAAIRVTPWAGGAAVDEATQAVTLPAGGTADVTFTPDPAAVAEVPFGVYVATYTFTDPSSGEPVAERSVQFGIGSDTVLDKAREGEFLFGLDTSLFPAHTIQPAGLEEPPLLVWTRWMGADIIRGGFFGWSQNFRNNTVEERLAEVREGRALYEQYDMRVVKNLDPPDDKFAKDMEKIESRMTGFAERVAAEHADWLTYFEIGNEPDLPGFYEGPMSRYVRQYLDLHAAIHRGNPEAIVMNGGFAYREDRIAEFLSSVGPDQIEAIAYHAHGKGSAAEREGFRRVRGIAAEHGLGDKPLIQTESGLSAGNRRQEITKAQTCIQKMVYAQSEDVPLFLWFRLYMNNRSLGNTRDIVQPRPVVMAYRAMVETLRHHRFARMIDADDSEIELYLFEENDGPGRVIVGWANEAGLQRSLRFDLAANSNSLADAKVIDLFGNPTAIESGRGGTVTAVFDESPKFLVWDADDAAHQVAIDPGFLLRPEHAELIPDRSADITLTVRNPWYEPLVGRLSLEPVSATPMSITPAAVDVSLPPHGEMGVTFQVDAGPRTQSLQWPDAWQVFPRVETSAVNLVEIHTLPETLPGADDQMVVPVAAYPRDHFIDLARIGNYVRKADHRADAVAFAEVVSDRDQVVTIGAAGDYWMEWFVNGQRVYDTMANGNGATYSILAHTFELPLKAGRNLLAVRVLAGSHDWRLVIAPPEPVRQALGGPPSDALRAVLRVDDQPVLDTRLPVQFLEPLPRVAAEFDQATAAEASEVLATLTPVGVLSDRHIENYYERVPGDARWWNGDDDLSATLWTFRDDHMLHLVVSVRDQDHRTDTADVQQQDRVVFGLAGASDTDAELVTVTDGDRPAVLGGPPGMSAVIDRDADRGTTRYRIAVPLDGLPGAGASPLRLNVRVYDRDADTLKQHAQWRPGFSEPATTETWRLLRLGR